MPTIDDILRAQRQQSIFDRVASGASSTAPAPVPPSIFDRLSMATQEPLPMEGRLSFLPAMVTPERGRELALPGVLAGAWNAFTAPGRALQGQELGPDEALNVAGTAMLGGMPMARAAGVGGPGELGLNVFHGSPHKFDKFDISKIGTGEGAQAYGHGLYMAEAPGVAGSYRNPAGRTKYTIDGKNAIDAAYADRTLNAPVRYLQDFGGDVQAAMKSAIEDGKHQVAAQIKELADSGRMQPAGAGHLYKVDLPDEQIAKMLDWDKPLSQQPESVRKIAKDLGVAERVNTAERPDLGEFRMEHSMGADVVEAAIRKYGKEGASKYLREAGFPGIQYFDAGSRAGAKGTRNFVVFSDDIPKIIGRE